MNRASRLSALEAHRDAARMIVAKLPANGDDAALLADEWIVQRDGGLLVRIARPEGCGDDFARVVPMSL